MIAHMPAQIVLNMLAPLPFSARIASACSPVSCTNTSSSVGRTC